MNDLISENTQYQCEQLAEILIDIGQLDKAINGYLELSSKKIAVKKK